MSEKQRILIVDDTPSNITILNTLLKESYNVSAATNGPDALALSASRTRPDLILLDIMMPDMDGYEVLTKLKASPGTADIPVIFVTAKADTSDESRGFELGCVDYITKPVTPSIVMARVKTHLNLRQAKKTLEAQNKELKKAAVLREEVGRIARHDLKNPLTGVFSGIELLEMTGDLSEDQAEAVDIMKTSAHKMLDMINSSLDLFKMEQKIYRPEMAAVDMVSLLHRVEKEMESLIKLHRTGLVLTRDGNPFLPGQTVMVMGESLLLYSMMANLIKNAVEAVPEDRSIDISLADEGELITVCIHNHGAVPPAIRDTFFHKYTTSGKRKGTGLGTYSAKLIAETLGGKISMTSSEEDGTFIFIHLLAAQ
ncbi:MAG: hybrid sensor histidine kinase/response regulator [Desulfobacterales bacterium]|nr:hybrid sensor histidine kinase/response regulator [Desulfobacterales bacterium]